MHIKHFKSEHKLQVEADTQVVVVQTEQFVHEGVKVFAGQVDKQEELTVHILHPEQVVENS